MKSDSCYGLGLVVNFCACYGFCGCVGSVFGVLLRRDK